MVKQSSGLLVCSETWFFLARRRSKTFIMWITVDLDNGMSSSFVFFGSAQCAVWKVEIPANKQQHKYFGIENKRFSFNLSFSTFFSSDYTRCTAHEIPCDGWDPAKYCHLLKRKTPSTNVTRRWKLLSRCHQSVKRHIEGVKLHCKFSFSFFFFCLLVILLVNKYFGVSWKREKISFSYHNKTWYMFAFSWLFI